jgi:hypothetical protein
MTTSAPSRAKAIATALPMPLVGAGHYRGFPSQAARSPVAGFAVIWCRVHLLLGAWRVLLLCWLAHRVVPP